MVELLRVPVLEARADARARLHGGAALRARGAIAPLLAALLGLSGSLAATFALHGIASRAIERALDERLDGAGVTAAELLAGGGATPARLRAIMASNRLEGAALVSPELVVLADDAGRIGVPADLLRIDAGRVERALRGEASVGHGYVVEDVRVDTGYFPVKSASGEVTGVLVLEAGEAFSAVRSALRQALAIGVVLSALGAGALALAAARWAGSERQREAAAARASRSEAIARMAAGVAHDLRNPLGIIRAAVELVRERGAEPLDAGDRRRLDDVLGEVERLRRLTQDFLELSADVKLHTAPVDVRGAVEEAFHGSTATDPELSVEIALDGAPQVEADPVRLRQVLANLLSNAAQAGARRVTVEGRAEGDAVRLTVRDDGRGVDPGVRDRLFEAFATGRAGGTGLGLAVSRRIVERHGGTLALCGDGPGAAFVLTLPRAGVDGSERRS